jgi:hypothetical protein
MAVQLGQYYGPAILHSRRVRVASRALFACLRAAEVEADELRA